MQREILKPVLIAMIIFSSLSIHAQSSLTEYPTVVNNNLRPMTSSSFDVSLLSQSDSSLRLIVHNPEQKKLAISISHSVLGNVVDTTINNKEYTCTYHFENAEDGRYRILVSNGKEKFKKDIELKTVTTVNRSLDIH